MRDSEIERALRYWGAIYGPPPPDEWQEDSSHGSGALTGCLIEFLRVGVVSGPESDSITARGRESQGGAKPMKAHPAADRIDRLVCLLYATDRRAAVAVRAHYCLRTVMRLKVWWVGRVTETRVSRAGYLGAVARARHFIATALAERKAG